MDALNKLAFLVAPIFYKLLAMSISASGIGLILLLIRRFADEKISPRWKYMLWMVVIAALTIPYRRESERSVMPSMDAVENISYREEYDRARDMLFVETQRGENSIRMSNQGIRELEKKEQLLFTKSFLIDVFVPLIWFFGMVSVLFLWFIIKMRLEGAIRQKGMPFFVEDELLQRCQETIGVRERVECVVLSELSSPALVGIFRPRILLPEYVSNLSEESLSYILMHELAHFKRKDMWWNFLLLGLCAVYWFNPLIRFFFRRIREDMEVRNDDVVFERMDPSSRKNYARSLVEVLGHAHHVLWMSICMIDGKKNVERRIRMIKLGEGFYKKRKGLAVFGISLLVLLTACFFTESKSSRESKIWAKNLKSEEILRLETVVDANGDKEKYHRFEKEEYAEWVNWIRGFDGNFVEEAEEQDGQDVIFYVLTRDRTMHTIRCVGEYVVIDGDSYRSKGEFLEECPKEKANARTPKYFHYGAKREAFKGLELYVWKDGEGKPKFTLLPGTNALKTEAQIYDEEVSTPDLDDVAAELAMQKDGLSLFVMQVNAGDFTKEELERLLELLNPYMPANSTMSVASYSGVEKEDDGGEIPAEVLTLSPQELWRRAFEGMENATPRALKAGEIEKINFAMMQLLPRDSAEKKHIVNPVCHFFSSFYHRPEELDFSEFLWYFPGEGMSDEREEDVQQFEILKKLPNFPFATAKKLSDTVSPIRRVKRASVDEILTYYAGITVKQLKNQENVFYLKEYDSYYVYSSDFGVGYFNCASGEVTEDGIQLKSGEGITLKLEYRDGRYLIRSHEK